MRKNISKNLEYTSKVNLVSILKNSKSSKHKYKSSRQKALMLTRN